MRPGPRNALTDIAGLRVGNASDAALKSGVTVLTGDAPFAASVFVMGGAPGTRETDLLAPDKSVQAVDALVLSGGSAFGLAAAQGVMDALHRAGRGLAVHGARIPLVPAAILFDLANGGDKGWSENPYPALGAAALGAAAPSFAEGSAGAGTGALTAQVKGGLGSASLVLESGETVGALIAANPMGCAVTPSGRHFWAAPFEFGSEFGGLGPDPAQGWVPLKASRKAEAMAALANTCIAIVGTDAALDKAQCHRLAQAAHGGIARAVLPSHTPMDGDLVFAVSTGSGGRADAARLAAICHAASLCLARALARGIWQATSSPGDLLPAFRDTLAHG